MPLLAALRMKLEDLVSLDEEIFNEAVSVKVGDRGRVYNENQDFDVAARHRSDAAVALFVGLRKDRGLGAARRRLGRKRKFFTVTGAADPETLPFAIKQQATHLGRVPWRTPSERVPRMRADQINAGMRIKSVPGPHLVRGVEKWGRVQGTVIEVGPTQSGRTTFLLRAPFSDDTVEDTLVALFPETEVELLD